MTGAEKLLTDALRASLVVSLAALAVMSLRVPMRRVCGAELAYRLWLAPPLALLATLLPRTVQMVDLALPAQAPRQWAAPLLLAWGAGAFVMALLLAVAQAGFLARARAGRAGPAAVGVLRPRIVMPRQTGFTPAERRLMWLHERMHLQRCDPRARAWMALARCLFWWNPVIHLAIALATLDQELACDAAVLRTAPQVRPIYARTLLGSQLSGRALPLGAQWASSGRHPLETRLASLRHFRKDGGDKGPIVLATILAAITLVAWTAHAGHAPVEGIAERQLRLATVQNQASMSVLMIRPPAH